MFFKVSQWKGISRFKKHEKLNLRFIGQFEICERVGNATYRLKL